MTRELPPGHMDHGRLTPQTHPGLFEVIRSMPVRDEPFVLPDMRDRTVSCARRGCGAARMRTCVWIYGCELDVCVDHWLQWQEAQRADGVSGGGMGDRCRDLAAAWGHSA